ncbi:hypothetical protein D3C78_1200760 [compost metagenome]
METGRRLGRARLVRHLDAGQQLGFGLVGGDEIHQRQQLGRERPGGRRIEHHPGAVGAGQTGSLEDALQRYFQLQQQGVGVRNQGFVAFHHGRSEGAVGLGGDADAVLPLVAHIDDGDAGREVLVLLHCAHVDAIVGEARLHLAADGVVADAGDKGDGSTEASGGHRLIGPLAAGHHLIAVTGQGFTRARKVGNAQHMVCIDTAQNDETIHVDYS